MKSILIFTAGAILGSLVTFQYAKMKYEKIANEEIASVKATYERAKIEQLGKRFSEGFADGFQDTAKTIEEEMMRAKGREVQEQAHAEYQQYANRYKTEDQKEEKEEKRDVPMPYVITPEEFSDGEYATETLTYYADGVLTDSFDEIIDNPVDWVGEDFEDHFGEYEEDAVYVRNEERETDYEILRDNQRYEDIEHPFDPYGDTI